MLGPNTLSTFQIAYQKLFKIIGVLPFSDTSQFIYPALSRSVVVILISTRLRDNAKPHTIHMIKFLFKDFKWKLFEPSPYWPDLARSNYYLFSRLKKKLGGQQLPKYEKPIATFECIL